MFILISYDGNCGLCFDGKFDTHKEAYEYIFYELENYDMRCDGMPTIGDYPFDDCNGDCWGFCSNFAWTDVNNGCEWRIIEIQDRSNHAHRTIR